MSISRKILSTSSNGSKGSFADDLFSSDLYKGNSVRTVIENGIQLGDTIDYNTNSLDLTGHNGRATGLNSSDLSISGNFYISFWIKTQAYQSTTMILDGRTSINGSQMVLYFEGSSLVISRGTGIVLYANTIHADHPDEWVHVVFSRIGSTLSSFVGGDRINTTQDSGSFSSSSNNFLNTFPGYNQSLRNCQLAELKLASALPTGANPYVPTKETCIIPTGPEKVTIGTKILCFSGSDGSSSFLQNKVNQSTITVSASPAGESPFGDNLPVAGEGAGGMVWIKSRSNTQRHAIVDTGRGVENVLASDETGGNRLRDWVDFNDDGFTIRTGDTEMNIGGWDYVAWTFRNAPKFFDVVTYTGDGVAGREIPHNLGSTPGFIIVKRQDDGDEWTCYASSLGATKWMALNQTASAYTSPSRWNDTEPTDSVFTVGIDTSVNSNTGTYVAYLFAHDDSEEGVIQCGSYTGNGSTSGPTVDLGFEPQWLLIKNADVARDWIILDTMRGIVTGGNDQRLYPNSDTTESGDTLLDLTPTGFRLTYTGDQVNGGGDEYIYMAIRRPNKPAEEFEPDELFAVSQGGVLAEPAYTSGFPVDMEFLRNPTAAGGSTEISSRVTGNETIKTNSANAGSPEVKTTFDHMEGWRDQDQFAGNYLSWMFRRAPGFFDVVNPNSTSYKPAPNTHHHNLGVVPELIIAKCRDFNQEWYVGIQSDLTGDNYYQMSLNTDTQASTGGTYFKWGDHTDKTFSSTLFGTTAGYIHYLFASVPGLCDIGSYTGNGSEVEVNCGFTNGARWLLIKRIDSVGDWYFTTNNFNILLKMNTTDTQVNYMSTYNDVPSGFRVTSTAGDLCVNGDKYIYMAIA